MKIGGLQRFSLIDYPGKIAAIVFTRGCNFRCPYCYNPELVDPGQFGECIPEEEVFSFLEARRGKLDGIVITGGEPTLQPDLADFIRRARGLGYSVKLDTNGSRPEILEDLIGKKLLDYVAMDLKAPLDPDRYAAAVRAGVDIAALRRSIEIILSSGLKHEFRTTFVKGFLLETDFAKMGKAVKGAEKYAIQKFAPLKTLDPALGKDGVPSGDDLLQFETKLRRHVRSIIVR